MPKRKKQPPASSWVKRLGKYHIFSIPVESWLVISILIAGLAGFYYFFVFREYGNPSSETFVAEVSSVWTQPYESDTGGGIIYQVDLKRDDKNLRCRVPHIAIQLWRGLEIGQEYEFEVSLTKSRCYIKSATEIE